MRGGAPPDQLYEDFSKYFEENYDIFKEEDELVKDYLDNYKSLKEFYITNCEKLLEILVIGHYVDKNIVYKQILNIIIVVFGHRISNLLLKC